MEVILLIITIFFIIALYRRYAPTFGVPCLNQIKPNDENIYILDIRDYNTAWKDDFGVHNIPYSYLKRYYNNIPQKDLHIVAANLIEKNLGIRYLKKRGFRIVGYSLTDCNCKIMKWFK